MELTAHQRFGPVATVHGPDGSSATVALHGAHVISWRTADGSERLFVSDLATIDGGAAIRGGIPVCFPQFAALGPLPKHGFARTAPWRPAGPSSFTLDVTADAWPGWPHACTLGLAVLLGPATLTVVLTVTNPGPQPFSVSGALHTYLACADVGTVSVSGLEGRPVHGGGRLDGPIRFADPAADVDLALLGASRSVRVEGLDGPGVPVTIVAQTGFPDVVVWNVGATLGATMADLGQGQWSRYVCVEAAVVGEPVVVEPGSSWSGSQTITAG